MKKHGITIFTLLLTSLVLMTGWNQIDDLNRLKLQPESRLWIEGTSSLHDWTCTVGTVSGVVEAQSAATGGLSVSGVEVTVPVEEIECKNGTMNKKTRKALKATAHPVIQFTLDAATMRSEAVEAEFELEATGRLTMAGSEQTITMAVTGERLADGRFRFAGHLPLRMTDFDIKPPTALLGTIKTGDEVEVHFDVLAAVQPGS